MNTLERELYWEMTKTIKLLGGKSDILSALDIMKGAMPQNEAIEETLRLVN